ncbi:hypothetical protein [Serinibacter salmoneus]|uniref:Uncharacterized protein n=1 Tax=Serinibacter salmoneus TaxID=556530 RepID=A0A2A9D2M1_9MICO|nr:hypothetical protein [Serinibacter salmoneus]PFG20495.1 hypothetical protein ATL40_2097 [Serinibacter salmoneus]
MNRPTGMPRPRAAARAHSAAAARAALAARRSRQQAAARRRLVLVIALGAISAICWFAVGQAGFSPVLAALPSLVLVATLVMGVRTARAERAEWARVPAHLMPAPTAVAAAVAGQRYTAAQLREHLPAGAVPQDSRSEVPDRPEAGSGGTNVQPGAGLRWRTEHVSAPGSDRLTEELPALEGEGSRREGSVGGWTPVPVPVPTYTLKPAVHRRPAEPVAAREESAAREDASEAEVEAEGSDEAAEAASEEVTSASEASGIDLHAVLARRRSKSA